VIRRGAATSAVKAIAEFGQDNLETDGNEVDTDVLIAVVECLPVRLRKLAVPVFPHFGQSRLSVQWSRPVILQRCACGRHDPSEIRYRPPRDVFAFR
jgi:hypothetical protein